MNNSIRHQLLAVTLTFGLPLALVGCNQSSPSSDTATPTATPTTAPAADTSAPTPTTPDTNAPAASTNAAPAQ
ncbi:MAG: hypothetical protein LV480_02225 [Methylacidiphilales bacterium]|nr:hypothetical protein [Candidatus Methylacidiphilales bacterium]